MGHGKETPRQKMIGMMYLVLTALLALNVAKDVLDAFELVDKGLTKTTANFHEKNSSYYTDFESAYELNKTKVESWKNKADEVREKADALNELIQEYKRRLAIISEGEDTEAIHEGEVDLSKILGKDNTSIGGQVMMNEGGGEDVQENINEFRDFLLDLIEDKETYITIVHALESTLDTHDPTHDPHSKKKGHGGEIRTWESEHFENLPLASVVTILSKMQSDVRFAEAEILSYLLSQIDAGSFKFNKIEAVVLAGSDYVFKGQEYKARVFLAAYDSTKFPTIKLTSGEELEVQDGKGIFIGSTSALGPMNWGGTIILEGDGSAPIVRDFEASYRVAEASAVVSPTKMNVFYRSVKNPVAISVAGVPKESIRARISKGRLTQGASGWEVLPAAGPEGEIVTIRVFADVDGQEKFMGEEPFRVKDVPDPIAKIGGRSKGAISLTDLSRASGVTAEMEDFDFELEFEITEFTVSAVGAGGFTTREPSNGPNFTEKQKNIIRRLSTGKNFTVTDVKAIGPAGQVRTLNSIVLKIL